MSKNQSQDQLSLTRIKRFKLFEPSIGIICFLLITLALISSLFYLDYRAVARGFHLSNKSYRILWFKFDRSVVKSSSRDRVDFMSEEGGVCDLFDGNWVFDENYPLYQSQDCGFIDGGFRCSENGRPDLFYTKWRWQPRDCDLPRFDAKLMLEKLRNKRVVFVGDSIGRNQWESFLCMISSAIPNKDSIYEVNGSPITKHKGFLVFKFKDYNCTIEYYRAPFLVVQSRPPPHSPPEIHTTLKLDQMDWTSSKWKDADVLVFNSGHWWNNEKTIRGGCYFQEGGEVKKGMKVDTAYRKSIETVMNWINRDVNLNKTQVFFRTYAPVHFRGGDWRNGGSCHMETLPEIGSSLVPSDTWGKYNIFVDVLSSLTNNSSIKQLNVLNVTNMTSRRKDGHMSLYYRGPNAGPAPMHRQDCSHWCLPGVPDTWNELLYALFLKREATHARNSSIF